jgi:hypothetical protein
MGQSFVDKYSLLHLASGIVAFYFGIPLVLWILIHFLFEVLENSPEGVYFIDHYIPFWPGGKKQPDSYVNSLGDEFFAILGWILAYILFE